MSNTRKKQITKIRKEMEPVYQWMIATTVVIYCILIVLIIWLFAYWIPLGPAGSLPLAVIPLFGTLVYTTLSLEAVPSDKLATILFFGDPVRQVGSGLKFVPYGIASLQIDTRNYIQIVFGTPTQGKDGQIKNVKDVTGEDLYEVREPLRITSHGWKKAYYGQKPEDMSDDDWSKQIKEWEEIDAADPLGQKLTFDPLLIARFRIIDHPTFIKNIGSIPKVNRQIIDTSETALQAFIGRRTMAHTQRTMDDVNDHLTERVEWLIGEPGAKPPENRPNAEAKGWWGIDLESVQLKSLGLPERLNKAIADAAKSVSEKKARYEAADALRREKIREGQGAAKAQELLLIAKAEGYKKIAEALKTDEGQLIAQLEAMERALSTGDNKLFLAGGKFSDILESLASIKRSKLMT